MSDEEPQKNQSLVPVYTEESFWEKVKTYAVAAGHDVIENALKLYYCMQDSDTPTWAKTVIIGSLAYFIIPIDAVADFLPGGYVDDLGALAGAVMSVANHIKDEHTNKAKSTLKEWFGESQQP